MKWKERIKEILVGGLKYCFKPYKDGSYPEVDNAEMYGLEEAPGFIDAVYSAINYERRLAFFRGYKSGASDACVDMGKEFEFVDDASNVGAWKAWGLLDDSKS